MNETATLYNHDFMNWEHISDLDLERYYLGMVKDKHELAPLEEHTLACPSCAGRAEDAQDYVDTMRIAAILFSERERYTGRRLRGTGRSRR